MRGILIAAPGSGSGKTMLACGLLNLFQKRGMKPIAFKCGPDYIDPMFHRQVLGVESRNLDSFFSSPAELRKMALERWARHTEGEGETRPGIVVAEGVMGYFDGLGGVSARGSSWEIARILGLPVILVVDARGASLSLSAQIQGFLNYNGMCHETGKGSGEENNGDHVNWNHIAGVFLNRISPGIYDSLKERLERELPVPVLGCLPSLDWLQVESRHLGLVCPEELPEIRGQMDRLAQELERTCDVEKMLETAEKWRLPGDVDSGGCVSKREFQPQTAGKASLRFSSFRLAVARDEAFCFYYQENLEALEQVGAKLVYFSPLKSQGLPKDIQGLLLGGGYPELYAKELSENESLRNEMLHAISKGLPTLAECGGYLYLLKELEGMDGRIYPMVGAFKGQGLRERKLRHFGYVTVKGIERGLYLTEGVQARAHEFHYWNCGLDDRECVMEAIKPISGRSWPAIRQTCQAQAGFPHLYYPSCPTMIENFANACRSYTPERMGGK